MIISCTENATNKCEQTPDTSSISMTLTIEHFEDSVLHFKSKKDAGKFFNRHPEIRDYFFNRPKYPNDSTFINELFFRFNHEEIKKLRQETAQIFGDLTALKNELHEAFRTMKYYYPSFKPPKIQTIITGLESDIYVSEKVIIIGLDYYLGSTANYRPRLYDYMLRRYQKNFIVPSIALLYGINNQYNKTRLGDRTVLADMIAYGKAYYFAKRLLPCVPDSVFIGYTNEEIGETKKHSSLIWKKLIEEEVLYSTNHLIKQKYLEERPKTLEIGNKCPGRIATWVGWEIVDQYMKKETDVTLPEMMEMPHAEEIFRLSKYRPE